MVWSPTHSQFLGRPNGVSALDIWEEDLSFLIFPSFTSFAFSAAIFLRSSTGGFVLGILGDELAHHGELQDGLLELVNALFGGEEGVEVLGDALPAAGELRVVDSAGQRVQQGFHQRLMGAEAGVGLLPQLVAQRHQLVDFGDDAVLFGEWR